ncbi:hypothetical protein CARUB_v10009361mg [Capsella rubella]|uniref:Prolyl 4-hydroxylase alpha subunit domain-containing protein n=1 Tax=Capsella rubella TaxID=81985 RepID=R0ILI1_9BRAS|nr:uncharacterized PKHD-type hydroxylase At1g22950 [Capsella rubella]EOA37893.1 hypothetical protein CARUB_v10009361mg [Capsella rubella]
MAVDGDGTDGGGGSQPPVKPAAKEKKEVPTLRLSQFPKNDHVSDDYEDLDLEYSSLVLGSLEKYLPTEILTAERIVKYLFMSDVLEKYITRGDLTMAKNRKEYRQNIISNYQPRFRELYNFDPKLLLLPPFRNAISENTEESIRRIISEPFPGVFVFQMFHPAFFQILLSEVENFRMWALRTMLKIKRPTSKSMYGVVLDDFGLDIMLNKLKEEFIFPLCKVLFPEVCGEMFDSHHGVVVEYGENRSVAELGYQIDDSEITLNVCLSKQFAGGELCFRGLRCKKHARAEAKPEETFDYSQIPGQAILYRGCHRNGARATTSGYRANMILWCRNSLFREMETYQKECSDWCGQCAHETKEKESQILAAKRKEMIKVEGEAKRSTDKPWLVYVRRSKK